MKVFSVVLISFLTASCAQKSLTGDSYSRSEVGKTQTIQTGRITSLRTVKIEGGTEAGSLIGAIAGGFLGNEIGSGAGRTAAAIGGSLLGGATGSHTEKALGNRQGLEIQVALDGGKTISVVQQVNPRETFSIGDRVRIMQGREGAKVTH